MRALYSIGVRCMYLIIWVVSFFNKKAKAWIDGRKIPVSSFKIPENKEVVWFHCASLGEFDQGLPVMNLYKEKFPNHFLLVSFFSPSGMQHYHKRSHSCDLVVYLPLDTKRKAEQFVEHFQPKKVFFVKYEFWYNHLKAAKRVGAKVYGVSSLFRPEQRFFKMWGSFFRKALHLFDHFFCQDERSKELLASIGIHQASVTGDSRYDRMLAVKEKNESNPIIADFVGEEKVLLLGSSWPIEEQMFAPEIKKLTTSWKIIIAPHDVSISHIEQLKTVFENETVSYSLFQKTEKRILILDTIGQLTSAYKFASVAYVGGGFTGKLHNILEPGAFGVPVIIGPKHVRFPEAALFIQHKCAKVITDVDSFKIALEDMYSQKENVSLELATLFQMNSGTASRICTAINL